MISNSSEEFAKKFIRDNPLDPLNVYAPKKMNSRIELEKIKAEFVDKNTKNMMDVMFCMFFVGENPSIISDLFDLYKDFIEDEGGQYMSFEEPELLKRAAHRECLTLQLYVEVRILMVFLNAARNGSEYCKETLRKLYQRFCRKEYNAVKRFRSLNVEEIFDLFDSGDEIMMSGQFIAMNRAVIMAPFMGIELDWSVRMLYKYFVEVYEEVAKRDEECDEERLFAILGKSVNNKKALPLYEQPFYFVNEVLKEYGVGIDAYYDESIGSRLINTDISQTKTILNQLFGNDSYTEKERYIYAALYGAVRSYAAFKKESLMLVDVFLGTEFFESKETILSRGALSSPIPETEKEEEKMSAAGDRLEEQERLLKERDDAMRKLQELEDAYSSLMIEKQTLRKELDAAQQEIERHKEEQEELAYLRNHLYQMNRREISEKDSISIQEMKSALSDKKLIIIGGNQNWVKKIKQEFPKWTYIGAMSRTDDDTKRLEGADYVYFFTGTLSHRKFYRYINILRDKRIPFGYIQGVNIDNNVQQIYQDLIP